MGPETFVTKTGQTVTLIPVNEAGDRFDIEYVKVGVVIRHRTNLGSVVVDDLRRLEGWRKP